MFTQRSRWIAKIAAGTLGAALLMIVAGIVAPAQATSTPPRAHVAVAWATHAAQVGTTPALIAFGQCVTLYTQSAALASTPFSTSPASHTWILHPTTTCSQTTPVQHPLLPSLPNPGNWAVIPINNR